ncbi:unnamed protein product [Sphagnum troendelagicum]
MGAVEMLYLRELEQNKRLLANLLNGRLRNCAKDARDTIIVRALPRSLAWFQISCENTNPTSEELEQKKRMPISLGNGARLRNCAKDARDTIIVRALARSLAWFQISCENTNPTSEELEQNKRMLISLGNGVRLRNSLRDERSEPDERRFGDRDSNSRSSSSSRRREVASYLAGELSREMQTPHQKKTLKQETTTDPMQI